MRGRNNAGFALFVWREEMRGRGETEIEKKLIRWAHKSVQFIYRSATEISVLLLEITSELIPKNCV